MIRSIGVVLAGLALVTTSTALADASTISLSVNPSTLQLQAGDTQNVSVTNIGDASTNLTVAVGDYAMTPSGTVILNPRNATKASASRWLAVSPSTIPLNPGESTTLSVRATPPSTAAPGDHEALVLLSGSPVRSQRGTVVVNARLGIGVLVRVPGDLHRHLTITRIRQRGHGAKRTLQVGLTNMGNVNEVLARGQATATFKQGGRTSTCALTGRRSILPGAQAVVAIRCPGALARTTKAVVTIRPSAPDVVGTATVAPVVHKVVRLHP
jgi:hypothetical protein